eukprot:1181663-Prorocentrum_minimum.AAC.1
MASTQHLIHLPLNQKRSERVALTAHSLLRAAQSRETLCACRKHKADPSSGMRGIAIMLHACEKIDLYGFRDTQGYRTWYWDKYPGFKMTLYHPQCLQARQPQDRCRFTCFRDLHALAFRSFATPLVRGQNTTRCFLPPSPTQLLLTPSRPPPDPLGLDTDSVEWTVQTLLSHLITR